MSEDQTLTYSADVEQVTTSENLNESEQESLEIGEQMVAEQETLLAGKYKDTQELETAYKELEKKLGEKSDEDSEEAEPEAKPEKETEVESNILDKLWEEKDKGFSDETLKALGEKRPGELAKMYLEFRSQAGQQEASQTLTESDISELKGMAGGEQEYERVIGWATSNLPQKEQDMFDSVIDRGDPQAAYFAVQALMSKYKDAVGSEGDLITGKAPSNVGSTFQSQPEVVAAMSDPRYDSDPAYRRQIMEKLERSNIEF
jgi:hypothetical protein